MKNDKRVGETRFFFDGKSKTYFARPDFDRRVYQYLMEEYGLGKKSVIAELGAGTGKFTYNVAPFAGKVFAVEPNKEMFLLGKETCAMRENVEFVFATAEETTLAPKSLDFALAVQSFHYFDKEKLLVELGRILKDDGKFAVVWNMSGHSGQGFDKAWSALLQKAKIDTTGSGDNHNLEDERKIIFKNGEYEERQFSYNKKMSFEDMCNFARSISFVPKEGDDGYEKFYQELKEIFKKYKKWGKVEISTTTTIQIGEINR